MKSNISIRIALTIVSLLLIQSMVYAQSTDSLANKNITVTRDYQPNIENANKIIIAPIKKTYKTHKISPQYADISTPLNAQYNVQTLLPKSLQHIPNVAKSGFARIGIGNPLNTLADVMLPILVDEKNRLDFTLKHLGAFSQKKHSESSLSLQYNHLFEHFDFYTMLGAKHDYFNYYGEIFDTDQQPFNFEDLRAINGDVSYRITPTENTLTLNEIAKLSTDEQHMRLQAGVGVRSLPLAHALKFDAALHYRQFQAIESGVAEHELHLKGLFEVPTNDNRLGMKVDIHNLSYQHSTLQTPFEGYTLMKINPYYRLVGENWWLRIGAKTGISIGAGQLLTPSPDVALQWNAVPRYFAIFAGVTGDVTLNSLNRIYGENRYLSSHIRVTDTYTPINSYVGVKVSPTTNLIFDLFGQYSLLSNPYFYVNKSYQNIAQGAYADLYHHRFDVVYGTAPSQKITIGGRIAWDYQDQVSLYAQGAYHSWDVKNQLHVWQMPEWEADFGASLNITQDIVINTQFVFQDGRYALLKNSVKMDEVFDWNIGGAYTYTDALSFFIKFNNILHQHYEHYKGYRVQGFNAMAGATFAF